MKIIFFLAAGVLAASFASAQAVPPKLEFEVASIRPAQPSGPGRVDAGLRMNGSQAHFGLLNLKEYIAIAYRVQSYRITGPDWIAEQRFNIDAKLPEGSTVHQIREMLQSRLAERFQLKVHRETKELPAYARVLGKPPLRLKQNTSDPGTPEDKGAVNIATSGSSAGVSMDLGNGSSITFANDQFDIKNVSMEVLAALLSRYLDRPVVDMTALKGKYDMKLPVTPDDYRVLLIRSAVNAGVVLPPPALRLLDRGRPASLFDALQQQGLDLDSRKLPLEMIVVDQAQQTPTPN